MKYRNIHNGRVIDIPSVLTSPDWKPVADGGSVPKKKEAADEQKSVRKNKRYNSSGDNSDSAAD